MCMSVSQTLRRVRGAAELVHTLLVLSQAELGASVHELFHEKLTHLEPCQSTRVEYIARCCFSVLFKCYS